MSLNHYLRITVLALFALVSGPLFGFSFFMPKAAQADPNFCGNKHKNLVRLQTIVQGSHSVVVPEFVGIPTGRVETYLRTHVPQIFDQYAQAVELLQQSNLKRLLVYLKIFGKTQSAEDILKEIQATITQCFIDHEFTFTPQELALFEGVAAQKRFFMVRSTGVEDGAVANAGGNASIAYVAPDAQALQKAMGEVIASYFGMQSLKNRMGGGEVLSATDLYVPVLIQLLIGEAFDGSDNVREIPISGVAYTTNQSLSSSNFTITEINAAYGHGEGVVANRVVADRYYVTQSRAQAGELSIYPMLYDKVERLVPHQESDENSAIKRTLVELKNSKQLAQKSALSTEQVTQLHTVLKKIEADYGQPMDVEFVVVDATVYIVQARPAMHSTMKPSYVAFAQLTQGIDISAPMQTDIIVSGKSEVLVITNPADIIVTKTLDEADQMPASTKCKAVIVNTWAASLSHAAVNFKSYGTPCMVVSDLAAIRSLIAQISPKNPLIIDVQQSSVCLWQNGVKDYSSSIVPGWIEHPIDRTYSMWTDAIAIAKSPASPLPVDGQLLQMVNDLKKATDAAQQKTLLADINERVSKRLSLSERRIQHIGTSCDESLKTGFAAYKTKFEQVMKELTASIEQGADRFEILFYHKMLEALLYQGPGAQTVLGGYTCAYFLNELYDKQVVYMAKIKFGMGLQFADYFNF